jgi:hypothetical protein
VRASLRLADENEIAINDPDSDGPFPWLRCAARQPDRAAENETAALSCPLYHNVTPQMDSDGGF